MFFSAYSKMTDLKFSNFGDISHISGLSKLKTLRVCSHVLIEYLSHSAVFAIEFDSGIPRRILSYMLSPCLITNIS